jgi:hypothetical protein
LKEHGLPARIDRSLMSNFSGAVATQLMTALRFLDLIDEGDKPTAMFKKLVEAHGTDEWTSALAAVVRHAYREVFKIDLTTASPSQMNEAFKNAYAGEGDTLRKATTFFLNAVADAQIPISSYITKNTKPRSGPTKKRTARSDGQRPKKNHTDFTPPADPLIERKLSEQVLAILDTDGLEKDVESAVFVLLKHLRKEGK